MVRFVLGRAGKGKTRYIFDEIARCLVSNPDRKMILLVPEQYTLQAERDLIEHLRLPGLIHLEVLSISRLAERVFEETGGIKSVLINEQGRQMSLRKVIEELSPDLALYSRAARQPGFIEQCADLMSEFKQNMVDIEDLARLQEVFGQDQLLWDKLHDAALIYQGLTRFLQDKQYIDNDDYLLALVDRMHQAASLQGAYIWVDSFVTFSPLSLRIIQELMLLSSDISITLTLDPQASPRDADLFEPSRRALTRLQEFARKSSLQQDVAALFSEPHLARRRPELGHLESELYAFPAHPFDREVDSISIRACPNIYDEIDRLAREIIAQARDRGLRWRDMAVVCGDIETYGPLLHRTFEEYGIPCFIDSKRSVMNNPLVRFILSLIDTIQNGYLPLDIMSGLKTGLTGLKRSDCEALENYVLRLGIKGRRWKKPFTRGTEPELAQVEGLRQKIVGPLQTLEADWNLKPNCRTRIASLFSFMHNAGIKEHLEAQIDSLMQRELWEQALESAQIWNIVSQILEQLAVLTGELDINLSEFRQLLETGLSSYELAIIPPTVDQVLVGSVARSKSQKLRVLFVVGTNDGVLPAYSNPSSLLNNDERGKLSQQGLELGWNASSRISEENFLIYHALSQPRDRLYLSWPVADIEGRALRPSLLLRQMQRIFPQLAMVSELGREEEKAPELTSTPGGTFKYLVKVLRDNYDNSGVPGEWQAVYRWYKASPEWTARLAMVDKGLYYQTQDQALPSEIARQILPIPLYTSVSRLERFVLCPFSHFLNYGLQARERKMYSVEAPDLGDFYHRLLFEFSVRLSKYDLGWSDLSQNITGRLVDEVLKDLVPEFGEGILESSFRNHYLAQRLGRVGLKTIQTLSNELLRSNFQPGGYEIRFGRGSSLPPLTINLDDGENMYIEGRIDRIDLFENDKESFIRIIDYKSGRKDLNLSDVYHGLSLQLLVYLKALLDGGGLHTRHPVQAAGVLYVPIDDPLLKADNDQAELGNLMAREMRFRGMVLEDVELLRNMDKELESSPGYLPVNLNKDTTVSRLSSTLDRESFNGLFNYLDRLLQNIGRELKNGKIDIAPVKSGNRTACQICQYQSVCQFDRRLPGNRYKVLTPLSREAALEKILNEGEPL
ncbi:MAG: helicase-exonuclease AddAB subunit AddB [Syntrophomonadaceae bacterium]